MATVLLGAGFAAKANACTIIRSDATVAGKLTSQNCVIHPPRPHPISGSIYNASVDGTVVPSTYTVNANTVLAEQAGTIQSLFNYNTNTYKVWFPHTYFQAHKYTSNGKKFLQIYVSTQSAYAPSGDSATFVFDQNGNLASGNSAALSRIQTEIQEADPQTVAQVKGIVSWLQGHWGQITACATFAGGLAAGIGGIVAIAGSGGLATALIGLGGAFGGAAAIAASETACF